MTLCIKGLMLLVSKNVFINARHDFSLTYTSYILVLLYSKNDIFQQCTPHKLNNFPFNKLSKFRKSTVTVKTTTAKGT